MTKPALRLPVLAVLASAALLLAGCGGGGGEAVPAGAVATVDGTEITRSDLDALVERARKQAKATGRDFPKAGTPTYQSLQSQLVNYLVQKVQYEKEADALGVEVSGKDVDAKVDALVKGQFGGSRTKLEAAMKQQGYTMELLRSDYAALVLRDKLVAKLAKDVTVTDEDIRTAYQQNAAQYTVPESREVRHILLAVTKKDGGVDYSASRKLADDVYEQLKSGADFAALAKKYSKDPSSAANGGKYNVVRGQTVAPFELTAFSLEDGELSQPVKTEYGYHLIEPLGPVKPGHVTPFSEARNQLSEQLRSQRQNEAITEWAAKIAKKYEGKTSYAAGFAPPTTTTPDDGSGGNG